MEDTPIFLNYPQPVCLNSFQVRALIAGGTVQISNPVNTTIFKNPKIEDCPYGVIGGRTWVKEDFLVHLIEDYSDNYYRATRSKNLEDPEKWMPAYRMREKYSRFKVIIDNIEIKACSELNATDFYRELCDGSNSSTNFKKYFSIRYPKLTLSPETLLWVRSFSIG